MTSLDVLLLVIGPHVLDPKNQGHSNVNKDHEAVWIFVGSNSRTTKIALLLDDPIIMLKVFYKIITVRFV